MDMYEQFMYIYGRTWICIDIDGRIWTVLDMYGKDFKNGWMCQNRLEFLITPGIYLKLFLDTFGVVINGLE